MQAHVTVTILGAGLFRETKEKTEMTTPQINDLIG